MIEWTTPTECIIVLGVDLTERDVWVSIAQGGNELRLQPDSMSYDAEVGTLLACTLTQQQTGSLHAGTARIQVNAIDSSGYRAATKQATISIGSNLLDEEVQYANHA